MAFLSGHKCTPDCYAFKIAGCLRAAKKCFIRSNGTFIRLWQLLIRIWDKAFFHALIFVLQSAIEFTLNQQSIIAPNPNRSTDIASAWPSIACL